jgi:hypothetical protein
VTDDEALVQELVAEVEAHLAACPADGDTAEGILQRWILQARFLRGLHCLEEALRRLVASGRLEQVRLPDGRVFYRAARGP